MMCNPCKVVYLLASTCNFLQILSLLTCSFPVSRARSLNSGPLNRRDCQGKRPVFQRKPKHGNFMSVDLWLGACLSDIESLRSNPLFPLKPTERAVVHGLSLSPRGTDYCHRITGYLTAPRSGVYMFHVSGSAEVWISTDSAPANSRRIIEQGFDRQTSNRILLTAQQHYYFEIISCAKSDDKLQVLWLTPGNKDYVQIDSKYLRPISSSNLSYNTPSVSLALPILPQAHLAPSNPPLHLLPSPAHTTPCAGLSPAATHVREVEAGAVHPADYTDVWNERSLVLGNHILPHQETSTLKQQILHVYPALTTISSLKVYPGGLVWLEGTTATTSRVGAWLGYQNQHICKLDWLPSNNKTVTMVVGVKGPLHNQMKQLLENLAEIQEYSVLQFDVNLVIVDFNGGTDNQKLVDLLNSQRVEIVQRDGDFDRGLAMSVGALHSPAGSLLFFVDLHVQLPLNIAETLWTHTIRGKAGFAPALIRLNPQGTPDNPNGHWEMAGFGLLSVFRDDFFNSECDKRTPTYQWGGEDHYFVNKLLENNISILRRRLPGLFHFHHDRNSLWNGR